MRRRQFLKSTLAGGGAAAAMVAVARADEPPAGGRDFFEWRSYFVRANQREKLDAYFKQGLLPALGRLKAGPVGLFHENPQSNQPVVHLLLKHADAAGPRMLMEKLGDDAAYLAAAKELLGGPQKDSVCDHIETSLLAAIPAMPRLEAAHLKAQRYVLRIYEAFNLAALRKKAEMFQVAELAIFRRVGLRPVFFSEAVVGSRLPNLTYLLAFDDEAAEKAAWKRFGEDAEWQKLRAKPEYADKALLSRITNKPLVKAEGSEI